MKEELEKHTIEELTEWISKNPEDTQAYFDRGKAYFGQEKYKESISDFDKVIKQCPENPVVYILKGIVLENLEKYKEALSAFNTALEKDVKNYLAYFHRGNVLDALEKFEEAISDYDKAIKIDTNNSIAYTSKGLTLIKLNKCDDAIEFFDKAIEKEKDNPSPNPYPYYFKGIALLKQKKYENTNSYFDKAIEKGLSNPDIYYFKGIVSGSLKQYDDAISAFDEAIEKGLNDSEVYYYKGIALKKQNKYDDAILPFKKAIELDPKYTDAYSKLGGIYYSQMKYEEAAITFVKGKIDLLGALGAVDGYKKLPKLLSKMLDYKKDVFFNTTIGLNSNQKKQYKKIYISTLQIVKALHINTVNKVSVAHYTKRNTATALLFNNSKLRLNSVITANDLKEGQTLIEYLFKDINCNDDAKDNQIHDYQAFIGCFTFNHESLNQFRLYGKEADKEATGVSLVLNNEFFNDKITINLLKKTSQIGLVTSEIIKDNIFKTNTLTEKSLFRCIYIDPTIPSKVISLGHKEEYSFYREKNDMSKAEIRIIKSNFNNLQNDVEKYLNQLSKFINKMRSKDLNYSNDTIICELLLPLRYLVKHAAFKEEQECRIFEIKDLKADKAKNEEDKEVLFTPDCSQMYIEYQPIAKEHLDKIIFAPKANGVEIFKKAIAQKKLKVKCVVSTYPFA